MDDESVEPDEASGAQFHFYVPPEQEAGIYANNLAVWHTAYEFTLDFAAAQPPQAADPENLEAGVLLPFRVVSRVRIPVTLVFDVLKALNERMSVYESEWGEIKAPQPQGEADGATDADDMGD